MEVCVITINFDHIYESINGEPTRKVESNLSSVLTRLMNDKWELLPNVVLLGRHNDITSVLVLNRNKDSKSRL